MRRRLGSDVIPDVEAESGFDRGGGEGHNDGRLVNHLVLNAHRRAEAKLPARLAVSKTRRRCATPRVYLRGCRFVARALARAAAGGGKKEAGGEAGAREEVGGGSCHRLQVLREEGGFELIGIFRV